MAIQLIALDDDFSSFSYGTLGPSTSLTAGLRALASIGEDEVTTETNFAFGGQDFTIVGSPSYTTEGLISDVDNYVNFNLEASGGDRTMAFVFYVASGVNNFPFSAFNAAPSYGEYLNVDGSGIIRFETISVGGGSGGVNWPSVPRANDRFELVLVRIKNNVSIDMYRPRDAALSLKNHAGVDFDLTGRYHRTSMVATVGSSRAPLFAEWSRALSDAEANLFYSEMQGVLAARGIDIT